jgi:hypothetical protein
VLADAILVVHFMFVLFVVGGCAVLRARRSAGTGCVSGCSGLASGGDPACRRESLVGVACPLTVWEDALRRAGTQHASFVGRWVARLLYYDFPEWVFAAAYVAFALAVALAWHFVPPHPARPPLPSAGSQG